MNEITTFAESTMSSREIAKLCDKRHDHVMDDCRKLADFYGKTYSPEKAGELVMASTYVDPTGRTLPCFAVTRQASLDLVTGYSLPHRHAVNKRWQELEVQVSTPAFQVPQTLSEALRLAANQAEQIETQQMQLEQQRPAVEFAHAIKNTSDAITVAQMAAVLGIGRNRFYAMLRGDHVLMADNLPYQHYKERGYFRVIESVWVDDAKEPHPTFKTLVTGRGQVYLTAKYGATAGQTA